MPENPKDPFQIVLDRYQQLAATHIPQATSVLKTDCYNEGFRRPIITPEYQDKTTLLEYSQEHIDKALEANPSLHIIKGDIRHTRPGSHFDLILDFSTIDHVPQGDTYTVFENYHSMLKHGGKLILIAWFNATNPHISNGTAQPTKAVWNSTDQYFFDYGDFVADLRHFFTILSEQTIADQKTVPA